MRMDIAAKRVSSALGISLPVATVLVATVLGAAVLGALLPAELNAQQTEGDSPTETFTDIIDVRVVEVEVVVTDRDGNRVSGLEPGSFRLFVDREAVPVEYFSEIRGGSLVDTGDTTPGTDGDADSEVQPAEVEDPGRSFLVFIDDYFTDRRYRHRLLKNLAKNVPSLRPQDRMAVVRFEGYGLEVLTPWTSARGEMEKALDEARSRTPRELVRQTLAQVSANPVQRSRILGRQISEVANAMAVAMRSFNEVPGRKLLVPMSQGWPFDPTLDLSGPGISAEDTRQIGATDARVNDLPGDLGSNRDARTRPLAGSINPNPNEGQMGTLPTLGDTLRSRNLELLYPMVDTANLLGYTIYPMTLGTLDIGGGGELQRTSLWILARETGGRIATEGAAASFPLEPVVEDTGSYYVLGFSPERAWDGERHRVEVEVTGDGFDVRHRRNFLDLSRRQRMAMRTEEALLMGEGGDLDVAVGDWGKARGRKLRVPVSLRIPMDWVTMVPTGGQYVGDLELRVAALDERGGRSEDIPVVPIELKGPKPPPNSYATYETQLEVRNIEQRLVLYLYDKLSGESKVAALEIEP